MKFLLDTCAFIFLASNPDKLAASTRELLNQSESELHLLVVSAWEIGCAHRRGRLRCDRPWPEWFRHHAAALQCRVLPVTLPMIEVADALSDPFHKDPVDRIIVGCARSEGWTVITTDKRILDYPHVQCLN